MSIGKTWLIISVITFATFASATSNCANDIIFANPSYFYKNSGTPNPLLIAYDRCDDISKRSINSEDFAKTTYWSKVVSSLSVRASTAASRYEEHPVGLASDIAMVFISPWIKQSVRNQMVKDGNSFSAKTILQYYPQRLGLNLAVSSTDAALAFVAGVIETNGDGSASAIHGVKRLVSNGVTYIFLDPLLTGITDYTVMHKLLPFLISHICKKYSGKYALWLTRGAIAVSFLGMGAAVESIQFLLVRDLLFSNQDVKKTPKP